MATPPSCVPPGLNVSLITGPLLLGYMFSYGLLGILVVQMFLYITFFSADPLGMRIFVWIVFFFECVTTIFATISAWNGLGAGWGDLSTLSTLDWSFDPLPALSGFLASTVHFFFCWRIYKLTGIIYLPLFIAALSIVQWFMAFYIGVKVGIADRDVTELFRLSAEVIVWLVGSAVCDIIITCSMVIILFRANSKTTFSQTNTILAKLINFTVETGMTTSVGAVVELILFLIFRNNNLHFIWFLMLSKLYSNTLLASLNSRIVFGARGSLVQHSRHTTSHSSGSQRNPMWDDAHGTRSRVVPPRISPKNIQIATRTEVTSDDIEMAVTANDVDNEVFPPRKSYAVSEDKCDLNQ